MEVYFLEKAKHIAEHNWDPALPAVGGKAIS